MCGGIFYNLITSLPETNQTLDSQRWRVYNNVCQLRIVFEHFDISPKLINIENIRSEIFFLSEAKSEA